MTNRFNVPNPQFFADPVTGAPLAGGLLYFYASGTSTQQNTYADFALATPNTNPVVLDSNGYAGTIFLSNLAYKVVLKDSNAVTLYTEDPVSSSDYTTFAQVKPWAGNPNGSVAGTASTQGSLPGSYMIWDYVNNILYVCTTTGTTSTAVWTAVNASASTTAAVLPPTGRLTPTSGTPVITTDVVSNTSLVYTPYVGNTVPIYNGTAMANQTFTELTLTLTASQASNTIYDVFVFNNSGVLTLVTGPAWSVSTAGSGARGTGASTTQLSMISGILINAVQITGRNGATSYVIASGLATYLGSILIDGTAGQISCYLSWGQSRKWAVWNAYNRVPIVMQAGDSTASWAYNTATIRESNGGTTNIITTFCGLSEEEVISTFRQDVTFVNASQSASLLTSSLGIGLNSTTVYSGLSATFGMYGVGGNSIGLAAIATASYNLAPALGSNILSCLEKGNAGSATTTYAGTNANMVLTVQYNG